MSSTSGKRRAGRPAYEPSAVDRAKVEMLRSLGKSESNVAEIMRISIPTLRKHYAFELAHGKDNLIGDVATSMGEVARDKSHREFYRCAKYIMATIGGYTDEIKDITPAQVLIILRMFLAFVEAKDKNAVGEIAAYLTGFGSWYEQQRLEHQQEQI